MYGDLSRLTFRPERHFSAVVVQQGRVTLDADANEQAALERYYARKLAADLIGPFGGPANALGFGITVTTGSSGPSLAISPGRYYVGGILCELDGQDRVDYAAQPNGAGFPALPDFPFLVYLKVWERYVSYVEDPMLREVALGLNGPDTTGRLQVMWQVLAVSCDQFEDKAGFYTDGWPTLEQQIMGQDTAMLGARAQQPDTTTDVCVLPATSGYRGTENQLYRVEIHRGGETQQVVPTPANGSDEAAPEAATLPATFMWSRDNGSVMFPVTNLGGNIVTLATLGRDPELSLEPGNYVEIVDDVYEAQGEPGPIDRYAEPLHQVTDIDPVKRTVTLDSAPTTAVGSDPSRHPFLRRWDQEEANVVGAGLSLSDDTAIMIDEEKWIELEDGVQILFTEGGSYRAGDYWLIPARVATGDVEWPQDTSGTPSTPLQLPPFGVRYQFAPLAFLAGRKQTQVTDLRLQFAPLAQ